MLISHSCVLHNNTVDTATHDITTLLGHLLLRLREYRLKMTQVSFVFTETPSSWASALVICQYPPSWYFLALPSLSGVHCRTALPQWRPGLGPAKRSVWVFPRKRPRHTPLAVEEENRAELSAQIILNLGKWNLSSGRFNSLLVFQLILDSVLTLHLLSDVVLCFCVPTLLANKWGTIKSSFFFCFFLRYFGGIFFHSLFLLIWDTRWKTEIVSPNLHDLHNGHQVGQGEMFPSNKGPVLQELDFKNPKWFV